ncbi:guanylate cyclase soluble subunit beta-2-like isoform X3 [Mytilus californianus]|uniref:guanylate cyclase soluble subunit beta-2-like isoform X1 n=1 Tax=Mytilus californianus TaxID=6549 RepID=UPI0022482CFA|nr:guanylate cyclase soluble subunit beta-2-like isoform X1 [Mytilus californianus]XP_052101350.1 guanylate cyclase soluble subunit beta-2-like isoform X2 [Mytilus californianus]XP_052101426.1 guanylate cyclase soluble subunit beta-2-like isoform X3 [Mytilus californianus]
MYGQIHLCVRELVLEKFGQEAWDKIIEQSDLNDEHDFMVFHKYSDECTFGLIGAVCKVSGLPLADVLEVFGEYFLTYCMRHGYDKMLRTLGGDFISFVQNLDSLHALLSMTYKNISAPSFRCERETDGSVTLHYYTIRPGLYPIVLGLVKAVARDLYHQAASVKFLSKSQHIIEGGKTQEHVIFKVQLVDVKDQKKQLSVRNLEVFKPAVREGFQISADQFCHAFPYHIIFNERLEIQQCGRMIQRVLNCPICVGMKMSELFDIIHPIMKFTIENIRTFINSVFMLGVRIRKNGHRFTLKGQMIWLEDIKHMIFISSPRISSLTELMEMNVFLSDIPLYDVTRELVLLNQQRIAEIDVAKQLDETTAKLKLTSKALENEQKKTEELLSQMLPKKIADDLKNGRQVKAEKFETATILFTDIVTFTNIASACPPMDIVNLLNELYNRFDQKTNDYEVYKVETIGDAYMVVSGVPTKTDKHAQPVADFAMEIVEEASKVRSPITGKPIQIRVGIHSGPVVAGVVGKKMPRYCLFGDTVNTASRMESHGVPGRIHMSGSTAKVLMNDDKSDYILRDRGVIEVKGKGSMNTYILVGKGIKTLHEPNDSFNDLPIAMTKSKTNDKKQPIKITDTNSNNTKQTKSKISKSSTCVLF